MGGDMRWGGPKNKDREIAKGLKTEINVSAGIWERGREWWRGTNRGNSRRRVAGKSSKKSDDFWSSLKEQAGRSLWPPLSSPSTITPSFPLIHPVPSWGVQLALGWGLLLLFTYTYIPFWHTHTHCHIWGHQWRNISWIACGKRDSCPLERHIHTLHHLHTHACKYTVFHTCTHRQIGPRSFVHEIIRWSSHGGNAGTDFLRHKPQANLFAGLMKQHIVYADTHR